MNFGLNYITAASSIAGNQLELEWISNSRSKQLRLVVGKSWSGLHPVWRCARDLQNAWQYQYPKNQEVLATSYIPNHKRGHIL